MNKSRIAILCLATLLGLTAASALLTALARPAEANASAARSAEVQRVAAQGNGGAVAQGLAAGLNYACAQMSNGRQRLRWTLSSSIQAASALTFRFGVSNAAPTPNGVYTSTVAVRTSASAQDVVVNDAAPIVVQVPATASNGFQGAGSVTPSPASPSPTRA
jgi:hypothetical protein